jgi:hypothetical protein
MMRLDQVRQAGLSDDQVICALALAVEEIGEILALHLDYGARAKAMHAERGGQVRFDADGGVLVPVPDGPDGERRPGP